MKTSKATERGQALIIIALAAVGLFAMVGLAIDGAAKFSDQRQAQSAADTAALAGALSLSNGDANWKLDALQRAQDNGYIHNLVTTTVNVYRCTETGSDCGFYDGDERYVQVVIDNYINTTFARVVGINQLHNHVQAVALAREGGPLFDGASIVSLNPGTSNGCSGTFRVGGSSTITLNGGGMFVNSNAPDCAFEQIGGCSGVSDLLVINGGGISSAGDGNVDFDGCTTNIPSISYNEDPYVVPEDIEMPDVPDECGMSGYPAPTKDNPHNISYLHPGRYTDFPPNLHGANALNDNIVLDPGVYCVTSNIHWTNSTFDSITGTGVTIYLTSGHGFRMEGGDVELYGPARDDTTTDYAGYVIIADTSFSGSLATCTINGGSNVMVSGTILAPYCDLTINGDNSSGTPANLGTQVIAWNITLNGSSAINLTYDPDDSAEAHQRVGLIK